MDDNVIEGEDQNIEVDEVSDEELAGTEVSTESDSEGTDVEDLIDKIIGDDNVGAKSDFEALISSKLDDLLNARKQEIAKSLYSDSADEDESQEEVSTTENEEE